MQLLVIVTLSIYALILSLLFIYGINFYYFTYLTIKHRDSNQPKPELSEPPRVTVQLPVYNERYVVRRLIETVCCLDWPVDRLEIQILDDSTDETTRIVAQTVRNYQQQGVNIVHLHRENREGYKAGALAHGMEYAEGEFIAIFDADFLPPADFLHNTVPYFVDKKVGFVQTRWGHLNDDFSLLTRLQALSMDGHFMVEQFARNRSGFLINFNGTAGVWRRTTIDDAGGWQSTTLTEDLDLSYRAQLKGWRGMYLRDVETPGELLITMNAYRRQQYRWARGSFECVRRLVPDVLSAPLTRKVKFQALLHLTGYGIHILMFLLALLYPVVAVLSMGRPYLISLYGLAVIFNFTALAPTTFFTLAQHELGHKWSKRLPSILFLTVLGSGMMVNNVLAILHAFTKREGIFERTPKLGMVGKQRRDTRTYKVKISPRVFLEVGMLLFNLNTCRLALAARHYIIAVYAGIFAAGLAYILWLTLWQSVQPFLLNIWLRHQSSEGI